MALLTHWLPYSEVMTKLHPPHPTSTLLCASDMAALIWQHYMPLHHPVLEGGMQQKWQPWLGYVPLHTSALHGWWKAVNARHGSHDQATCFTTLWCQRVGYCNARFGSHDQATCFTTLWGQRVGYWAMPDLAVMTRQHVSPHSGAKGWDTEQCQIWQSWSGNMFHHPQRCTEVGRLCMLALSILRMSLQRLDCPHNVLNVAKLHCRKRGHSPKNVTWFTRP